MFRLPKEVIHLSTLIYYDRELARSCHKNMKRFFLMCYLFDSVIDINEEIWMVCETDIRQMNRLIDGKLDLLGAYRQSNAIWISSVEPHGSNAYRMSDKIADKNLHYDLAQIRNMMALMVGKGYKFFPGELDDIRKMITGEK